MAEVKPAKWATKLAEKIDRMYGHTNVRPHLLRVIGAIEAEFPFQEAKKLAEMVLNGDCHLGFDGAEECDKKALALLQKLEDIPSEVNNG